MDLFINIAKSCMPFLYFLRDISNPVFDVIFSLITHLGEETVFLVIALVVFWCINKREGYYVLIVGLVGTVFNQFAKLFFRVPRPWDLDSGFKIVESARAEATGYSFPSGHTQNIAGTLGSIAAFNRKRWLTVSLTVIIVLVAFSRMYLGVHTPLDVITSLLFALLLVVFLKPLFATEERFKKSLPYVVIGSVVISLSLLIYVLAVSSDTTLDYDNLYSAMKNASTLFGCTLGLVLVYFIDTFLVDFKTDGKWYAQVIKLLVGFGVVIGIKAGLSTPLELLFGNEFVARAVRYFIIVAFAGAVWPLSFKKFSELSIGPLDNFTEKLKSKFAK